MRENGCIDYICLVQGNKNYIEKTSVHLTLKMLTVITLQSTSKTELEKP